MAAITRERAPTVRPPRVGDASEYIHQFRRLVYDEDIRAVVLWCRVSGRVQKWRDNLDDQDTNLRSWAARYGVIVLESYPCWGSWWKDGDTLRLEAALNHARRAAVPLLAETTDRFIRHGDYHSQNNTDAWPTVDDFDRLRRLARGVKLATVLWPDAPPAAVRWFQQHRGHEAKGNAGGRPRARKPGYKRRRRKAWLPEVLELHYSGYSLADISLKTGVPRMTAYDWIMADRRAVLKER